MKLNLGCGSQIPDDWVNVDYSLGARLMKVPTFRFFNRKARFFNHNWDDRIYLHDLTTRFPWGDSSVDVIYSSHTLEHFSREDGHRFLAECHRVLRNEGILRIIVPDLRYIATEYLEGRVFADDFVERLGVLYGVAASKWKNRLSPFYQYPHKCMYDTSRLIDILNEIGFRVRPRLAFDSDIEDIRRVELKGRTENAVIVEGRKT